MSASHSRLVDLASRSAGENRRLVPVANENPVNRLILAAQASPVALAALVVPLAALPAPPYNEVEFVVT